MKTCTRVRKWIDDVIDGKVITSKWVRMACQRQQWDLERFADDGRYYFDEAIAAEWIDEYPNFLTHTKGAKWCGKPFELSPSQQFINWCVFGWRERETDLRRFRSVYITVARKWGKSTYCAGTALMVLFMDYPQIESGGEIYVAATKEDQAKIVHTQACQMVKANAEFEAAARLYKARDTYKSMVLEADPWNGAVFKPLGSDSDKTDGLNPSMVIKDELHEWTKYHRGLKEKLETGSGARSQPLDMTITTAGDERSEIWKETDDYACKVLRDATNQKIVDDTHFAFIARLDEPEPCECAGTDKDCKTCGGSGEIPGDDIYDEANWVKANPEIGTNPTYEDMRTWANRAKNDPSFEHAFRRYHCNIRVRSKNKVINPTVWNQCGGELSEEWGDSVAYGAWDIGTRRDLASIAACLPVGDRYELRHVSFCPEDGNRDLTRHPWNKWIEMGWLIPTPGDTTDITVMRQYIIDWSAAHNVNVWAFDPHQSRQLGTELYNDHGIEVFEFLQTDRMYNEPIELLLRSLAQRKIRHDGDQLLAWAAENLVTKRRSGKQMPDKEHSDEKIDPIVACLMALERAMRLGAEHELEPGLFFG